MKHQHAKLRLFVCLALFAAAPVLFAEQDSFAIKPRPQQEERERIHRLWNTEPKDTVIYQQQERANIRQITSRYEPAKHRASFPIKAIAPLLLQTQEPLQANWGITVVGTPQLENYPEAKAAFQRVATRWSGMIRSIMLYPTTFPNLRLEVDFGPTFFGTSYESPVTIGTTTITQSGIIAVASFPEIFRGSAYTPRQMLIYGMLPFPIKTEYTDTVALGYTYAIYFSTSRGTGTATINPERYRHAIGFNSAIKFDFDPSDGIDADKLDFEAAVLRELGHVFGFNSNVGQREFNPVPPPGPLGPITANPTVLDLYRFRPGVTMESFTAAPRVTRSGGEQIFFTGDVELPLSTGRQDGTGGDGRPAAAWKDDELTGQYLGVMDPTLAPGLRGGITANDLLAFNYFSFIISPGTDVMEVLSVDDNSREETLTTNGALLVNRFTPARFPFTLQSVRVRLDASQAVGKPLRIVAFGDAARTGQPPANPPLLVDRTINIPALPEHGWLEVMIPNGPTLNSGDLYVGVQSGAANLSFAGDANSAARQRSFISTNNGASFQPLRGAQDAPLNLMLRAVTGEKFDGGNNLTPELVALSPNAAPTGASVDLYVSGRDFKPETVDGTGFRYKSVVRWNGQERDTTFLSPSLLRTRITSADLAAANRARVTVFTSGADGGRESAPLDFTVTAERPAPALTRLDPATVATGAETKVIIEGRNFTAQYAAQLNGQPRTTRFLNSTKLEATIPAGDLTAAANLQISVATPAPGGGTSNALTLRAASCNFQLSKNSLIVGAARTFFGLEEDDSANLQGVSLTTADHCQWTAGSNANWLELTDTKGAGNSPIGFDVKNNLNAAPRTGVITAGGQTLTVTQVGRPRPVSSASYEAYVTPASIVSLFGVNLARTTQIATGATLPTTLAGTQVILQPVAGQARPAQLFFVSPSQINFFLPPLLPGDRAVPAVGVRWFISVLSEGQLIADGYINVASIAPGLFSADAGGKGLAAAVALRVKADGTQSYEPVGVFDTAKQQFVPRPIELGPEGERVFLILFGTGIRGRTDLATMKATIGGVNLPVAFAGAQGDFSGLDQVNIELPRALAGRGSVPVTITADQFYGSNTVTVTIK